MHYALATLVAISLGFGGYAVMNDNNEQSLREDLSADIREFSDALANYGEEAERGELDRSERAKLSLELKTFAELMTGYSRELEDK